MNDRVSRRAPLSVVEADVLDPSVMPAVDTPTLGGLSLDEMRQLLAGPLTSPGARGLELTIFDPDLDEDGSLAAALTDTIIGSFHRRLAGMLAEDR
jgi:arginase